MPRDDFVLKIQRELFYPKFAQNVSGLSRNGSQAPGSSKVGQRNPAVNQCSLDKNDQNFYSIPVDNSIGFGSIYLLNSTTQALNNWGQLNGVPMTARMRKTISVHFGLRLSSCPTSEGHFST